MKRKVLQLRLSPNEEARIIREELDRRRKLRIQQVREQQREIAVQIRREVEQRRQHELRQLEEQLREDWERRQREKLQMLQSLYQESLQLIGQSHRRAKENELDRAAVAQREEDHHAKAEDRYREALKELKSQMIRKQERQKRSINARKKALQMEKERAAKVASLPLPPPDPIQVLSVKNGIVFRFPLVCEDIDPRKPHVVKKSDLNAFAATRYHMPESAVERELETVQPDAREEADLEARRLQDLQREEERRREEWLEKACVRGRQALRREQLVQDRERLLVELEHMQQSDLLRRRQQVSQMPPQIFQPLYKRQETRDDFQREMEFAFEDMYTGERRVKGDLVVQLVPEPLPASSTTGPDLDQDLDLTVDENCGPEAENIQNDFEDGFGSSEQETPAEVEASRPPPRRALRKLLDRIRSQRSDWIYGSSRIPVEDSPSVSTDLIPEQDTSIETGSLTMETDKHTPMELCEPTIPPPTVEPTEPPAAESSLPAVFLSRSQEVEERKKREAELELEKQQQVALLQELEEQKAQLEQMLQDAQQEREHLRAAVTQEALLLQPQLPVPDRAPMSLTSEVDPQQISGSDSVVCSASEDGFTRRVREFQQLLLEQNRIHQRSVEVARQRLEEYQRALRIRHSMTATLLRPPVHPAGLVPPSLSEHLSAPPQGPAAPPAPPDAPPSASSSSVGSGMPSDRCVMNLFSSQRPDVAAQLTDSILERVTRHLPERLRPSPVTKQPYKPSTARSTSTSSTSDLIRAAGPDIPDSVPLDPRLQVGSLVSREEDQTRRGLQEDRWWVMELREAAALPERRRAEEDLQQMRRQKEALQALMDTEERRVPEVLSEGLDPEDVRQKRLELLASLLRAMEESNGGSLSHLEEPEEGDGSLQQTQPDHGGTAPLVWSVVPAESSGLLHPPRTQKPPVTRVRLGFREMMPEQHELSAIQEVETPVNMSRVTGPEDDVPSHPADVNLQDGSGWFSASDRTLQSPSVSSCGPGSADRQLGSETSSHLPWRERLLSGAGTSPDWSESDSAMKVTSALCSDSGRGADSPGPAVLSSSSPSEPLCRPAEPDWLSSTTISSGSYISTDPELNAADEPQPVKHRGSASGGVSSPDPQTPRRKEDSASVPSALSVDSVFNDSSIQRIIDKYTSELNISLRAAGTTDSEGPSLEESSSSVSQQSKMEDETSAGRQGVLVHAAAAAGWSQMLEKATPGRPALECLSPGDPSLNVELEQDSFQLHDQSSGLAPEERPSVLEQLVGRPSAHSSMIGPQPPAPASLGSDLGRWDSTLSRMIGRLSQQSGSCWLSPGLDFYAGRVTSELPWMDEFLEESRMRPLRELEDSAEQHSRSSAAHGVSTDPREPLQLRSLPEASDHSPSVSHVGPQSQALQNQAGLGELDPHSAEDSFHSLMPELTHNETADLSMTFHLPEHNTSESLDRDPASEEPGVSTSSVEADPSPEQLRAEEPNCCRIVQEALSQLALSDSLPQESVLLLSPALKTASCVPLGFNVFGEMPALCTSEAGTSGHSVPVSDQDESQQDFSTSELTSGADRERGILEQSQITLVSLTDTTLQDQDMIATEDGGLQDSRAPESIKEHGQETIETKGAGSTSLPEEGSQTPPVSFLEFQWRPSKDLQDVFQQKRWALIQRSNHRVQEIKTKRSVCKNEPQSRVLCKGGGPVKANRVQSATWKEKTMSKSQNKTEDKVRGGQAAEKKLHSPAQVSGFSLKITDEVWISAPEQRKRNQSEMHQRTQRLYEQLEEVKQQRAARSRQEDSAKNRLKAKEFHRKTLQKLRAKQTAR
ncbi:uncharacterized protein cep295 isoform 3-T3 [Anableps anableps]